MAHTGKLIVIEGIEGSGKTTQLKLLETKLESLGYEVLSLDFPQYTEPSSHFVREYLHGKYGDTNAVDPYTASLFYALDRFDAAQKIRQALSEDKLVLASRFTASNMAHQGTKFAHVEERRGYFIWLDNLEFELLKIPRPDMNFVLRVPVSIDQGLLVDQKVDLTHLERTVQAYDDLCSLFPQDFQRIDCIRSGKLMSIEAVQKIVWEKVSAVLPKPEPKKKDTPATKAADAESNPFVVKTNTGYEITEEGQQFLEAAVTNTESNVYGFYDQKLSPVTIAAGMARLSRRGDDMRITLLDEFAHAMDNDSQLLHRIITAYGDDSVQQLVGQYVVVEGASNLLTKKLEWGRLAAYLEQSTRYIYFDQKGTNGKYKYYVPDHFDGKTKKVYEKTMDSLFEQYSELVHRMTDHVQKISTVPETERDIAWKGATRAQACDAIRPVLPVATTSTVGIFASGQALESLIMHLLSDELPEARETGQKILDEARKTIPTFLERADKPERGGAMIAYRANTRNAVKKIAEDLLSAGHSAPSERVVLTDIWPKNELDIVADMLYEHSDMPLREIRREVESWSYDQKLDAFNAYIGERLNRRHRPGRALEKPHYSFDLFCDYGIFRDLQRHRMVDDMEWQVLTPRYGFEVPPLVEEAGLSELFERCFDTSLELYSTLQAAGYIAEAQYATLLGHKMRWKVTMNAREAFHFCELRTAPQGHPGYRKLSYQMYEAIAERHPLIAGAMKFVNSDEDPELTRLAAERYTQFKLQNLGNTN